MTSERPEGRALDALVAEKVMGHRMFQPAPLTIDEAWEVAPNNVRGRPLLHYSTDISDAFEVVEHLHARVFANNCQPGGEGPPIWPSANYLALTFRGKHDGWAAAFTCVENHAEWWETPEQFGGALGATASLAICNAALAVATAFPDVSSPLPEETEA